MREVSFRDALFMYSKAKERSPSLSQLKMLEADIIFDPLSCEDTNSHGADSLDNLFKLIAARASTHEQIKREHTIDSEELLPKHEFFVKGLAVWERRYLRCALRTLVRRESPTALAHCLQLIESCTTVARNRAMFGAVSQIEC